MSVVALTKFHVVVLRCDVEKDWNRKLGEEDVDAQKRNKLTNRMFLSLLTSFRARYRKLEHRGVTRTGSINLLLSKDRREWLRSRREGSLMSLVEKKLYIWVCRAVTVGKMCRGSGREM
jgi:hypothetical protein